jgi:hypothetical protein
LFLSAFQEANRKLFGAYERACCLWKKLDLLFTIWLFCRDHFTLQVNWDNTFNYTSFFLTKPFNLNPKSDDALHFHEYTCHPSPYSTRILYFLQKMYPEQIVCWYM